MSSATRHALTILMMLVLAAATCAGQSASVRALVSQPGMHISEEQAGELEAMLGQLFIINVDGFGYSGSLALQPEFAELVGRLQIGGVIPHYGSASYERIRRTNRALAELTTQPLMICSDILKLAGKTRTGTFGDGYVGGFLGRFKNLPDSGLSTLAALNAFAMAAAGINVALGPTVDTSTADPRTLDRARVVIAQMKRFGLQPVLKHFPFLPTAANLHHSSPDTHVQPDEAARLVSIFEDLSSEAGIIMTTHLYDSSVDTSIATFSTVWNSLLRKGIGFQGLLMTDGLLMLKRYADQGVLSASSDPEETAGIDETAVWAARAILAGHDFLLVEGSAAQTTRAYNGLLEAATRRTERGALLRAAIRQSAARIARWKQDNRGTLLRSIDVSAADIEAAIDALPGDDADLSRFQFDSADLARLGQSFATAATH